MTTETSTQRPASLAGPGTARLALGRRRGTDMTATGDGGTLAVTAPSWAHELPLGDPSIVRALLSLRDGPRPPADLLLSVTRGGTGMASVVRLQATLARLQAWGVLDHVVLSSDGHEVARLTGEGVLPVALAGAAPTAGRLSPLAVLTVQDGRAVVQSGLSHLAVVLDPVILPSVVDGTLLEDPANGPAVSRLLDSAGVWQEDGAADREHAQWNAADLWFHRRTHESRSMNRYGGSYPLGEEHPPLAYSRPATGRSIDLPEPDLEALRSLDPPLAEVVETRRSIRDFAEDAPTLAEVGELLYRTCRARHIFREEHGLDVVDRPYPSGGSIHELDVYVVVPARPGPDADLVPPGLWRYAPDRHALDLVTDEERPLGMLVSDLQTSALLERPAPIGLLVTARFGRLMWKYETIAYALILKHVGALYQTFYLNATAMGLGVCGLGGASTSSFATATGEAPLAEGMVGAMVLGRPGSVPASPWDRS